MFVFQENKGYNLRNDIYLAIRWMKNTYFGTETIMNLGPKYDIYFPKNKKAANLNTLVGSKRNLPFSNCITKNYTLKPTSALCIVLFY